MGKNPEDGRCSGKDQPRSYTVSVLPTFFLFLVFFVLLAEHDSVP